MGQPPPACTISNRFRLRRHNQPPLPSGAPAPTGPAPQQKAAQPPVESVDLSGIINTVAKPAVQRQPPRATANPPRRHRRRRRPFARHRRPARCTLTTRRVRVPAPITNTCPTAGTGTGRRRATAHRGAAQGGGTAAGTESAPPRRTPGSRRRRQGGGL